MIVTQPFYDRAFISMAGCAVEFGSITGGKNGDFTEIGDSLNALQGVKELIRRKRDHLSQRDRRRLMVNTDSKKVHKIQFSV
jgi:hypothetical protein